MILLRLLIVIFFAGLISCSNREQFQPTIQNTIYDSAKLLTDSQLDSVFTVINLLNRDIGSQMVVITIHSLNGQSIEEYSIREAERLRIGRETFNDGILLTVAVDEREMRLEVGYGLELIIKDEIASRINREVIAPKFREGKFGAGIYKGLDTVSYLIRKNQNSVGKRWQPSKD